MPNAVDAKIDEITQAHVVECEKANVSRNVDETKRRVQAAIAEFSAVDILASGYWEGLTDAAKVAALRAAVLELAAPKSSVSLMEAAQDVVEAKEALADAIERTAQELAQPVKKARKPKAAA